MAVGELNSRALRAVFLLAIAAGARLSGVSSAYADGHNPAASVDLVVALKMYYNAVLRILPCGYPALGLPPLAPYHRASYDVHLTSEYCRLDGGLSNLLVSGLNDFRILKFTHNTTTNDTAYDILFPAVQVLAEGQSDGWALLAGYRLNLTGDFLLNAAAADMRLVGAFTLAPSTCEAHSLRISDFTLHFYLGDLVAANWNGRWDAAGNNFANRWMRSAALMWVQQIQAQVNEIYAQLLLPILNGWLVNVTLVDLIDRLVETSMQLNMVACDPHGHQHIEL